MPILAQPYIHAYDMLLRTSPTNTTFTSLRGFATCSSIVRRSASICVGWSTSVRPFHTGTPDSAASSSTTACSYPLYSIPSKMRPSTFAVSAMLSFFPICELLLSRNVTPAPSSIAATSNEHLVLVDVFSKSSTIFLPSSELPLIPSLFFAFRSCARSRRYLISAGVKSISVRKLLPFKLTAIKYPPVYYCCRLRRSSFRTAALSRVPLRPVSAFRTDR